MIDKSINNSQKNRMPPNFAHPFDGHVLGFIVDKKTPFNPTFLKVQQLVDIVTSYNFDRKLLPNGDLHKEKHVKTAVLSKLNITN